MAMNSKLSYLMLLIMAANHWYNIYILNLAIDKHGDMISYTVRI